MDFLARRFPLALASGFGVGYAPFAPGTWGSLWGVVLMYLTFDWSLFAKLWVLFAVILLAWWSCEVGGRFWGHDHKRIVSDEVAGQYLVLLAAPTHFWLLPGFILFRIFDITKPFPAGWLDRQKGGLFTLADDLAAGLYALLVLALAVMLWG
jgi:phosphatidylglycerophosphatase A